MNKFEKRVVNNLQIKNFKSFQEKEDSKESEIGEEENTAFNKKT